MPVLMGVGLSTIGPPASMGATVGLFALSAVLVTSHRGIRALGRPGEWSADEDATTAPSGGDPAPVVPDAGLD